jgi:hypothetical protein
MFANYRAYLVLILVGSLILGAFSSARSLSRSKSKEGDEEAVRRFLQTQLTDQSSDRDLTTRYSLAFVDLNGDSQLEVIVYIVSQTWCGSGGCTMLVLKPKGSTYEVVTETSVTRPPIRVLDAESHGWHNIGVWVQGGGIQPGYEAELAFDGRSYPRNPSVPPARHVRTKVSGKEVISSKAKTTPLY